MNSIALTLLALMGAVCSSPTCRKHCKLTTEYQQPDFKHVSELQHSSIAPWKLRPDVTADREPQVIEYAECNGCTEENMTAEPIMLQISVYERIRNGTSFVWCKCPFDLAVGCTCVKKQ